MISLAVATSPVIVNNQWSHILLLSHRAGSDVLTTHCNHPSQSNSTRHRRSPSAPCVARVSRGANTRWHGTGPTRPSWTQAVMPIAGAASMAAPAAKTTDRAPGRQAGLVVPSSHFHGFHPVPDFQLLPSGFYVLRRGQVR